MNISGRTHRRTIDHNALHLPSDRLPGPLKHLGQNFLSDPAIARRIAGLLSESESAFSTLVEIGPGRGILSECLSSRTEDLILIEKDIRLISDLQKKFANTPNVRVVEGDALSYPLENIPAPYAVVSNLPYNISVPLFLRLIGSRTPPAFMILMFQREVARRLVAKPGTSDYGQLSVVSDFLATISKRMDLLPGSFFPKPKVHSSVVTVRPKTGRAGPDTWAAIALSRQLFLYRRKTLSRAYRTAFPEEPDPTSWLTGSGRISEKIRVDDLSPDDFLEIARTLRLHAPSFFDRMLLAGKEHVNR